MPDPTSERILKFISEAGYRPQRVRRLARSMGIREAEYAGFRDAVKDLMRSGRVVLGGGNAVMLPQASGFVVGTYRGNPRGFGFVVPESPDEHGDLYIPPGESRGALTGDIVRARVLRRGRRGGRMLYEGRVVEILERGNNQFVGELRHEAGRWFVWPDGNTLSVPIEIADVAAKSARAGEQVAVEIIEYPKGRAPARGVIVKRLGRRGRADAAIRSIIWQYHLPEEFPPEVLEEARQAARSARIEDELEGREDLRGLATFTIDPEDARDFDDAISIRPLDRSGWEVGVHIADVSRYVRPGGALDREAYKRGNSVYFPGLVLPMLPEVLSNGVCSLQEGQARLVKSVFIRYDPSGKPLGSRFANGVIQSRKRLTYEQATAILGGRSGGFPREVVEALREAEKLARAIRKRRLEDGMLVLDLPEVELEFDEKGNVCGARPADTSFSHTLIEMFMVEANEAVARRLSRLGVPFLRRVHPEPGDDVGQRLGAFFRTMGHDVPRKMGRSEIRELLDQTRGRPEAFAVHMAVLRSFEKAVYSPKPLGHYALASEDYCHFTSPIRRYPDLTIHRLLDGYLTGRLGSKGERRAVMSYRELVEVGAHCSFTERRAEDAERELRKVLILLLLEKRAGESFAGVVTGVANVGVFVQLDEFLIDGLIRFADLPDDWWHLDEHLGALIGSRTGRRIRLGDRVRVAIKRVNIAARELDLTLLDLEPAGPARLRRSESPGGRRRRAGVRPARSRR